jgi:hypothetical protein
VDVKKDGNEESKQKWIADNKARFDAA